MLIHNEAQDGKDIVDGTFAILKRHFLKYVKECEAQILTSRDMANAMRYHGGVANMHFDVIALNRGILPITEFGCCLLRTVPLLRKFTLDFYVSIVRTSFST